MSISNSVYNPLKLKKSLMTKRILITEDHSVVRLGIVLMIKELFGDVEVKEAADFDTALSYLSNGSFDLLIFDVNIPGGSKTGMIEIIKLRQPAAPILILSAYSEKLYALRFIKEGADGYVSKDAGTEEIKKAILAVLGGNTYLSASVQADLYHSLQKKNNDHADEILSLSNRELEIVELLIKGHSTNMIAEKLHLQKSTISTHKAKIFEKLAVENIPELTLKAKKYFDDLNG